MPWRVAGHVYALLVVMVGWVFFRAASLTDAAQMLSAMAGLSSATMPAYDAIWFITPEVALALVAGVIGATPIAPRLAGVLAADDAPGTAPAWLPGAASAGVVVLLSALFVVSVLLSAAGTYSPFIYFRF